MRRNVKSSVANTKNVFVDNRRYKPESTLPLGLVVVAAIVLFVVYRADTNRLAALGSLFGFIVTALLVGITIEYVRTNQNTLHLLKEQWRAQNEVEVKFGLRARGEGAQVWALNSGLPNVVVTKLLVEMPDKKSAYSSQECRRAFW